jgi:hypothetical protein
MRYTAVLASDVLMLVLMFVLVLVLVLVLAIARTLLTRRNTQETRPAPKPLCDLPKQLDGVCRLWTVWPDNVRAVLAREGSEGRDGYGCRCC